MLFVADTIASFSCANYAGSEPSLEFSKYILGTTIGCFPYKAFPRIQRSNNNISVTVKCSKDISIALHVPLKQHLHNRVILTWYLSNLSLNLKSKCVINSTCISSHFIALYLFLIHVCLFLLFNV